MNSRLSNFYVRSSIFTILSAAAALLNYLLYPVIGRVLDIASFGNFTALSALSTQVLGVLLAFNLTSIYLVKAYSEKEARSNAQALQRVLVIVFVCLSLLLLLFSPFLGSQLKIDHPAAFLVVTAILLLSIPGVIWTGYLQGHKQLINVGIFNFTGALSKLIFAVFLASIFGVVGGLLGVLIGTGTGLLLLNLSTKRRLPSITSVLHKPTVTQKVFLQSAKRYIIGSVIIVGSLSLLQTIDITYAKLLFTPEIAGAYSGISVLSSALYYAFFLLIWIIIPEVSHLNLEHNRRLLRNTYSLIAGLGGLALTVLFFMQDFIVRILMGDNFSQYGQLLIWNSLYQIGLISITFYAYYLLVLRNHRSLLLGLCVIPATLIMPVLVAENPKSLIISLNTGLLLGFAVYLSITLLLNLRKRDV